MKRNPLDEALAEKGLNPTQPADRDAIERTAAFLVLSADRLAAWLKETKE